MATPTILFNSSTGSDTAASGAGPATALSGNGASLNGTTSVDLSANTPNLSGVATDGSAVLWVDTTSGRQYSRITAVNDGTDVVTVATAFSVTESGRNWGIGGKRATLNHADSRTLGADVEAGWAWEFEDDGSLAITTSAVTISAAVAFTIRGSSTSTKRLLTQSANAAGIAITAAGTYDIQNLIFENTNGTKTSAAGITTDAGGTIRCRNCRFGHSTNQLLSAITRTNASPVFVLHDCEVQFCTSTGIPGRSGVSVHGCYIHDNGAGGIATGGGGGIVVVTASIIETNTGDGINIGSTPSVVMVIGNTIHANTGDGLDTSGSSALLPISSSVFNNNFTANGNYGIRAAASTNPAFLDFNNYGTGALANTSGALLNLTAGANSLTVDPGYADAANGNFAPGTSVKNLGFPNGSRRIGGDPSAGTYGYWDVGIQREEAVGGGFRRHSGMQGGFRP